MLLPPNSLPAVDLKSCATLSVQPVPSWINALKPAALNTKQGFGLHLQRRCAEQIARGHSPRRTPIASHRNTPPPNPTPRAAWEPLWCYLIAAPAVLSWRSTQPAEARSVSSAPPRSRMQNLWLQRNTKEERGSGSVSQSRYRFSNPILAYPKTLFGCVTVAEGVRREGERKRLKCSCLARVYFHPALQSITVSFYS